jgi:hypothetical protein
MLAQNEQLPTFLLQVKLPNLLDNISPVNLEFAEINDHTTKAYPENRGGRTAFLLKVILTGSKSNM